MVELMRGLECAPQLLRGQVGVLYLSCLLFATPRSQVTMQIICLRKKRKLEEALEATIFLYVYSKVLILYPKLALQEENPAVIERKVRCSFVQLTVSLSMHGYVHNM